MTLNFRIKAALSGALLAGALCAQAAEVGGVRFDDATKLAGKDLKLNGLGIRTKFIVKVYAAGLYLPEKKTSVAEILKQEGPRRVRLVLMRDLSSEKLSEAFMNGLNDNMDAAEKTRLSTQIAKFNSMFSLLDGVKKGDVLNMDWIPGSGTQVELNGKKIGEVIPDPAFYNAVLRIWIGDKPVDSSLKPALLGEK